MVAVLRRFLNEDPGRYVIHINFPGGLPVDGPSASVSVATAVYSAITGIPVDTKVAMTGEVSLRGAVKPVGGVVPEVQAAPLAGAERVLVPRENWQRLFEEERGIRVIPADTVEEVLRLALTAAPTFPARGQSVLPRLAQVAGMARHAPPA